MKNKARAVVIGGGVVGVSTLYHLARKTVGGQKWGDCVLFERKELTSGSTWHAAGLLPLFNMSYSVGQIHKYSVDFYQELEKLAGRTVGFSQCSNIRLAQTRDRMDEYYQYAAVAETIGVKVEFLTPDQVKALWPLCETKGLIGAIRHPEDGYIQPADLTQALATAARNEGAEIYRNTGVTSIEKLANGDWHLTTDKGAITCEHLITASGNFVKQTGDMLGLKLPVIPVEHQYIVTEAHPAIQQRKADGLPEMGVLRDSDGSWYMREEAGGLLLGPYEKGAPVCYTNGPSADSEYELFQEDLDRLAPHIESAIERVPAFGEAGIKKVYNGAICYTPDGSPIIGPAWGISNLWLNEGHSFGVTAAGGAGWQLAEWIVEGAPTIDMLGVDPRRFGDYTTRSYLTAKNEEAYANVFTVHYPDEEREAGRPLRMAPCYDRMKEKGAVFGQAFGWERPNWFAPAGVPAKDDWSFRRSAWFEHACNEALNVRDNVGLLDMTAFAKCRLVGPGAEGFLNWLVANRLPRKAGRVSLCHALDHRGGVHSEFTILREGDYSFYLVSAGTLSRLDHDWISRRLADYQMQHNPPPIQFEYLNNAIGVLVLTGPKSRELLERVSRADFSNAAFPWLSSKEIEVGLAPALAVRVNFVGELGWELHHPIEYQNHIYDALFKAGEDLGLKPYGIRAMNMLRMEKSYRLVGTELSIEYAALESGLDRFVALDKGDFYGREGLLAWQEKGFSWQFATLDIAGTGDCDPIANHPVYAGDKLVGRVTSGSWGPRLEKALALSMLSPEISKPGSEVTVKILDKHYKAKVIAESPYDPENQRLRA